MSKKKKVVFTSLGLSGIGVFIGVVLILSGGFTSSSDTVTPDPAWQPLTLAEIYDPFGTIETDIDDYIWPTDVTTTMTSVFGEFRSTHFHAGIDISTHGQIGASVFAARDGFIEQIGVSPFGYGKYILMRHGDGYATLYAHLERFDDPIEERVYEHQKEAGQYSMTLNFEPDEFFYRQGETIAISGGTGSGPPHIHFEIRDTNNNPINPKFSERIQIDDRMPPIFNRIAAMPADEKSFVNDRITPVTVPAIAIRPGDFVIRNPITISGKIGLAVDVHDRNNTTWYRHGIYGMEFFLEDSLYYSLHYDRLPITHRHQIRIHYDHHLLSTGRGRYRKLFIEEGNALPFYGRQKHGSGFIHADDFEPGSYDFRVVAYDMAGNTSTLTGTLAIGTTSVRDASYTSPRIDNKPHVPIHESDLQIESKLYRDMLIVSISHPEIIETPSPLLVQHSNSITTMPFNTTHESTHQGRIRLQPSAESTMQMKYLYNDTVYTHNETIYAIQPENKGEIVIDEGNLTLTYDYGAVYYPVFFTVSRIDDGSGFYYSFNSTSSVLDKGIRYAIRVPEHMEPFDRSVVYTRSGSRWNSIRSLRLPETRELTGTTRRLFGDIKAGIDTTAPSISNVIVDGNRNMRLRFRISDDESDIDHSSLSIRLDDNLLIGRYEPDLSMVIYRTREPLDAGTYDLSISVRDRAGNSTAYGRTVTIR